MGWGRWTFSALVGSRPRKDALSSPAIDPRTGRLWKTAGVTMTPLRGRYAVRATLTTAAACGNGEPDTHGRRDRQAVGGPVAERNGGCVGQCRGLAYSR